MDPTNDPWTATAPSPETREFLGEGDAGAEHAPDVAAWDPRTAAANIDPEIEAISAATAAMARLKDSQRVRVLRYLIDRYSLNGEFPSKPQSAKRTV